jgi:hypothetical protein
MAQPASLALDGGDPRLPSAELDEKIANGTQAASGPVGGIQPHQRHTHDPTVTFEEYHFYAKQTRAEEESHPPSGRETKLLSLIFPSKSDGGVQRAPANGDHKVNGSVISDEEWTNASRALRTATRGAIFYLITTDILGPFALPYAFATMGWG